MAKIRRKKSQTENQQKTKYYTENQDMLSLPEYFKRIFPTF